MNAGADLGNSRKGRQLSTRKCRYEKDAKSYSEVKAMKQRWKIFEKFTRGAYEIPISCLNECLYLHSKIE